MTAPTNEIIAGANMARKPIIDSPDILDRIKGAKERLRDGHALMRVPVDPTDPDCVLADAELEIERLRALLSATQTAAIDRTADADPKYDLGVRMKAARDAGLQLRIDGKFGSDHYYSVTGSWPALIRFACAFNAAPFDKEASKPAVTQVPDALVGNPHKGGTASYLATEHYNEGWNDCRAKMIETLRISALAASPAAPAQSREPDKWVAKVRVTHKGYSMELSKYIAYALPEGVHELYAAPQPVKTERPANVEQCGCQISHAEFNPSGELKRVTIHYGENRVACITLPAQSEEPVVDKKVTVARMGYGAVAVGSCLSEETGEPGIIYMVLDDAGEIGRDTTDVYPVGSRPAADRVLAYVSFKTPAAVDQTISILEGMKAQYWPDLYPAPESALMFEQWASDPVRADKIPLAKHSNGAYADTRSYLIYYGWKSALKYGVAHQSEISRSEPEQAEMAASHSAPDINALGEYWHMERGADESDETYLSRINARKEEFKGWLKEKYAPQPVSGDAHD